MALQMSGSRDISSKQSAVTRAIDHRLTSRVGVIASIVAAGVLGGAISTLVGVGIDTLLFAVMVLRYRLDAVIAQPTSVVLSTSWGTPCSMLCICCRVVYWRSLLIALECVLCVHVSSGRPVGVGHVAEPGQGWVIGWPVRGSL